MTEEEKRQTYRGIRFLLEKDAKEAGVPFWNVDRLFSELCQMHSKYADAVASHRPCIVSCADFVPMSTKATSIPIIRPNGASEERVEALARAIRMHVCLLLSDVSGLSAERHGDDFLFGGQSRGGTTPSGRPRVVTWEVRRASDCR